MNEKRVVILCDTNYEELELWYPYYRLKEEGFTVIIAAIEVKEYQSKHGYPALPDASISNVNVDSIHGVIIPGGFAPDRLRRYSEVLHLVREVDKKKGLVAAICHGPWVMISAGILKNRRATSFIAIKDDLMNAQAEYRDEAVIVDENIITSRTPADLPFFLPAIIQYLNGKCKCGVK